LKYNRFGCHVFTVSNCFENTVGSSTLSKASKPLAHKHLQNSSGKNLLTRCPIFTIFSILWILLLCSLLNTKKRENEIIENNTLFVAYIFWG
jgi:hypothetical protein